MVFAPRFRVTCALILDAAPSAFFLFFLVLVISLGNSFGGQLACGIFLMMAVITYVLRVFWAIRYAAKSETPLNLVQILQEVKFDPPLVLLRCECYHYETRYRTVTRTNPDGSTYTTQESYQEKVVTFTTSEAFLYRSWLDRTGPIDPNLLSYNQLEVSVSLDVQPANEGTTHAMDRQKENFDTLYRNRDSHYWSGYGMSCSHLDPFLSTFCVVHKDEDVPGIMTPLALLGFAQCGFLVIFTLMHTRMCAEAKVQFRKIISS